MSFLLDNEQTWVERDFGLDKKLVKALSKLGFVYPTIVQSKCIPLALEGKDVLVRARTGAGKTLAFALPILHKILSSKKQARQAHPGISAVILVPTKELCSQIEIHMSNVMYYCRNEVSLCSLGDDNTATQLYRLQSNPDIVISTPSRLVRCLQSGAISLSHVSTLVIDEADLVLSFGYSDDVQSIISCLPKIFQGLLMSATLSPELDKFKRVMLHSAVILKLEESDMSGQLTQFYLRSTENDKYLILYVFLKLGLLQGKGLIFVNDVNKCYKLKLFLQQFFIPAAVLNAELPANSRNHILEEFNRGVFDYLIATDAVIDHGEDSESDEESEDEEEDRKDDGAVDSEEDNDDEEDDGEGEVDVDDGEDDHDEDDEEEDEESGEESEELKETKKQSVQKKKNSSKAPVTEKDGYGVSRGIDFKGVAFVINFDFPASAAAYTHRIGRTARGGASGTALSFVGMAPPVVSTSNMSASTAEIADRDEEMLRSVQSQQPRTGAAQGDGPRNALSSLGDTMGPTGDEEEEDESSYQPSPLQFNMRELDNFRYRVEDTLRGVTAAAVKEIRAAEIKREILNSAQLKSFFSANPADLKVLRHDNAAMHPIRSKEHLRHVPEYLVPSSMRSVAAGRNDKKKRRRNRAGLEGGQTQDQKRQNSKSRDPLFSVNTKSDTGDAEPADKTTLPERLFSGTESLGRSTSGRQKWKMSHKKGKFNPKKSKESLGVAGSFTKAKRYK